MKECVSLNFVCLFIHLFIFNVFKCFRLEKERRNYDNNNIKNNI